MSLSDRIVLYEGDITKLEVDAIVNAANSSLLGGGGVDGAIHRAAGPELLRECRNLGGCATGQAKVTQAYNLPCRLVMHTVGPVWRGGTQKEEQQLESCYVNSIHAAVAHHAKTIAFPCISTGVYGYPVEAAAEIACIAVRKMLTEYPPDILEKVWFVCFSKHDADIYRHKMIAFR